MTRSTVAIIPARYGSTRFPGKVLADLHGKPILQHVYERACRVRGLESVWIATDDPRVADAVRGFGGQVRMTSEDHVSGTDRIGELLEQLDPEPGFLLNIQGDEPVFPVAAVERLIRAMQEESGAIWTLGHPIVDPEEIGRPSVVKIARSEDGRALYFSRAPIPHLRDSDRTQNHSKNRDQMQDRNRDQDRGGSAQPSLLRHIGIYGFPTPLLRRFLELPPSPLERIERLEQLRALEAGMEIRVVVTEDRSPGIDLPEDLDRLRMLYPTAESLEEAGR